MQPSLSICFGAFVSACLSSHVMAQQYFNVHLNILGYSPDTQHIYVQESPVHSNSTIEVYAYDLKKIRYDFAKAEATTAESKTPIEFEQRLNALKAKLKPLAEVDLKSLKLEIVQQDKTFREYSEIPFNFSYATQFIISNPQFQTHIQHLHHYSADIQLTHAYALPKNKGILATFKSLTYPYGAGLYREESVILLPKEPNK